MIRTWVSTTIISTGICRTNIRWENVCFAITRNRLGISLVGTQSFNICQKKSIICLNTYYIISLHATISRYDGKRCKPQRKNWFLFHFVFCYISYRLQTFCKPLFQVLTLPITGGSLRMMPWERNESVPRSIHSSLYCQAILERRDSPLSDKWRTWVIYRTIQMPTVRTYQKAQVLPMIAHIYIPLSLSIANNHAPNQRCTHLHITAPLAQRHVCSLLSTLQRGRSTGTRNIVRHFLSSWEYV